MPSLWLGCLRSEAHSDLISSYICQKDHLALPLWRTGCEGLWMTQLKGTINVAGKLQFMQNIPERGAGTVTNKWKEWLTTAWLVSATFLPDPSHIITHLTFYEVVLGLSDFANKNTEWMPMQYLGHIYTKKLFVINLKFKFNLAYCILSGNLMYPLFQRWDHKHEKTICSRTHS